MPLLKMGGGMQATTRATTPQTIQYGWHRTKYGSALKQPPEVEAANRIVTYRSDRAR